VVDDNAEYLAATAVVVAGEGHHVLTAKDGPEALAILRERTVDLILVDYSMPVMNGEQFIDELRRFDRRSPVVLQTGYATERPAHEMLVRLDIQGYHDKTEGPDKLRLWVAVGLKAGARASV
jgi:CheY-like chemotaxis protein